WQEPDDAYVPGGRTELFAEVDTVGRTDDRRSDFDSVYGDWSEVASHALTTASGPAVSAAQPRADRWAAPSVLAAHESAVGLRLAAEDPAALLLPEHEAAAMALFESDGAPLDHLAKLADDLRRDTVGDDVTYVVNRNINFTNVCYVGCRFCAFAQRERD